MKNLYQLQFLNKKHDMDLKVIGLGLISFVYGIYEFRRNDLNKFNRKDFLFAYELKIFVYSIILILLGLVAIMHEIWDFLNSELLD